MYNISTDYFDGYLSYTLDLVCALLRETMRVPRCSHLLSIVVLIVRVMFLTAVKMLV